MLTGRGSLGPVDTEGTGCTDGAAPDHTVVGVVVGEGAVVRAPLVPDGDVALPPSPSALEVRILQPGPGDRQQSVALLLAHSRDASHVRAAHEQRPTAGHGVD